jgi:hypothetical protein
MLRKIAIVEVDLDVRFIRARVAVYKNGSTDVAVPARTCEFQIDDNGECRGQAILTVTACESVNDDVAQLVQEVVAVADDWYVICSSDFESLMQYINN